MSTASPPSDQPRKRTTTAAATTLSQASNGDPAIVHDEVKKLQENDPRSKLHGTSGEAKVGSLRSYSPLVTALLFSLWYFLTVASSVVNKKIYNYFPYPYFVSATNFLVGASYCVVSWMLSLPKRAVLDVIIDRISKGFVRILKGLQPCDSTMLKLLIPVGICHGVGHTMGNVSLANVPISFTQTIKALEPFFNAAATQFILGQRIPLPLWLSLAPIVIGVTMASRTESFNWMGFNGAMISNFTSTYRNIHLKKAMKNMDSTNLYAYTTIIALIFTLPMVAVTEGPQLIQYGFKDVIAKVGLKKVLWDLLRGGICYHLFNQIGNNILEKVTPLTHAVGNVSKRIVVIVWSIIIFGNKVSTQTGIGTCIAIAGLALYSFNKARMEGKKLHKKAA